MKRLWEVKVYNEDPDENPDADTRTETVVAWNAVDAIRHAGGRVAEQPTPLHFVTHPEGRSQHVFRIDSPNEGPVGDPLSPSIQVQDLSDEDWQ